MAHFFMTTCIYLGNVLQLSLRRRDPCDDSYFAHRRDSISLSHIYPAVPLSAPELEKGLPCACNSFTVFLLHNLQNVCSPSIAWHFHRRTSRLRDPLLSHPELLAYCHQDPCCGSRSCAPDRKKSSTVLSSIRRCKFSTSEVMTMGV